MSSIREGENVSVAVEQPAAEQPSQAAKIVSHPPFFQMIKEALLALNEKGGSSPHAIGKYMEEKHKAVLPENFRKMLALQLKNFASKGKLMKVEASYKLCDPGKKEKAPAATAGKKKRQGLADVYAEALNASDKSQALQIIREKDPKHFTLQYHNLSTQLDRIFATPPEAFVSVFPKESFKITDDMQQWLVDNLPSLCQLQGEIPAALPDRPKSIIIESGSRLGKTQWARSLGPHNYLCGILDFNKRDYAYSDDVLYNVIDDVTPNYLEKKHWKELLGAESNWWTKCKYEKNPIQIKGGIPSIVLCNPGSGSSYRDFLEKDKNSSLKRWTQDHCEFVFLSAPLF